MTNDPARRETIPGTTIPVDVNLVPGRVSNKDRDRAVEWLDRCYGDGYIEPDETELRRGHILSARTRPQLQQLLSDLPPYPIPRSERTDEHSWLGRESNGLAVVMLVIGILSVCTAIVPWVLLGGSDSSDAVKAILAALTIASAGAVLGTAIWATKVFG